MTFTYALGTDDSSGQAWILCLDCGLKSYHPVDISERYCGNCHQFHAIKQLDRLEAK